MLTIENSHARALAWAQRFAIALVCLLTACGIAAAAAADVVVAETAKALPESFGSWRAEKNRGNPSESAELARDVSLAIAEPAHFNIKGVATARLYASDAGGDRLRVTLVESVNDAGAYALFTALRRAASASGGAAAVPINIGTAGAAIGGRMVFFKGNSVAVIESAEAAQAGSNERVAEAARAFAEQLDGGENEIPVLVKHLPSWETTERSIVYAVSLAALQKELGPSDAELFGGLDFGGGTEAVVAPYQGGQARLVVIEQNTPQLAAANDSYMSERFLGFRQEGKAVPSAYRRKGNYLVFVLGQTDEQAANELLNEVKYEQLVRWLGDNPRAFDLANRRYAETTASVIITTLKATGLSLLLCLGVGAIFGGAVFLRRRSQQDLVAGYSDAGGMVRLNIDEITQTPGGDASKLLRKNSGS